MTTSTTRPRRIYLASSWRNPHYFPVIEALRAAGHEVYDFRNPAPGNKGFSWRDCGGEASGEGPGTGAKTIPSYLEAIRSARAAEGFAFDMAALNWADTCVLALPCGRSAHLELGYACGAGKDTYVLLHEDKFEPELMYLMNTGISTDVQEIIHWMAMRQPGSVTRWHNENRGHGKRLAGHALRLLREVVELNVAAGAGDWEIIRAASAELDKARLRGEFGGNPADLPQEFADCKILLDIFASYACIDQVAAVREKLDVLWERNWEADADGVLWRPRSALDRALGKVVNEAAARGEHVAEHEGKPVFMTLDGDDPALPCAGDSEGGAA